MNLSFENGNTIKTVIISNIVTLLVVILTLVWNASSVTSTVKAIQDDVERVNATQLQIIREQNRATGRIITLENRQAILQRDVSRLEDFHFNVGGASWPGPKESTSTGTRSPAIVRSVGADSLNLSSQ